VLPAEAGGEAAHFAGCGWLQVAMVQSLSGTGSCRLFAEFQQRWMKGSKIYIPNPTW
jgi:aspartate/tyrosine/aromatic aminotransferase